MKYAITVSTDNNFITVADRGLREADMYDVYSHEDKLIIANQDTISTDLASVAYYLGTTPHNDAFLTLATFALG